MKALRRTFLIAVFLALPPLTAMTAVQAAEPETITVFAAASMTDALGKLARQYNESTKTRNVKVRFSFAASSTLARQIEAGAPADIFISANQEWMDYLVAKNLIVTATRVSPVGNTLVMITPADSPLVAVEIDSRLDFRALIGPDARIVTGDPANVPVGMYAKKALESLGLWMGGAAASARRQRSRGSGAGRARRSTARHRLRDRRQGQPRGQSGRSRRRVIRRLPIPSPSLPTGTARRF